MACAAPKTVSSPPPERCGYSIGETQRQQNEFFWSLVQHLSQSRREIENPACTPAERQMAEAKIQMMLNLLRVSFSTSDSFDGLTLPPAPPPAD